MRVCMLYSTMIDDQMTVGLFKNRRRRTHIEIFKKELPTAQLFKYQTE